MRKEVEPDLVEAWNNFKRDHDAIGPGVMKCAEIGFTAGWEAALRCKKCGAQVDERWDCCQSHALTATPQPDPRDAALAQLQTDFEDALSAPKGLVKGMLATAIRTALANSGDAA